MLVTLALCAILPHTAPAQDTNLDSLWTYWHDESNPDSLRLVALKNAIWEEYLFSQPDSAVYWAQIQHDYAQSKGISKYVTAALNIQGIAAQIQGDYVTAIDYYTRGLKVKEEMGDKAGIAGYNGNIGLIYHEQGDYDRALEYYARCLALYEEVGHEKSIATALVNIGSVYLQQKEEAQAMEQFKRALGIFEAIDNKQGIANALGSIASIYVGQQDFVNAMEYSNRSLALMQEIGDQRGIATNLSTIGDVKTAEGDYKGAIKLQLHSLAIAKEIGNLILIEQVTLSLYKAYKADGNLLEALEMHQEYYAIRDSVDGEENRQEVIRQEYKYEYEKQAAADSVKAAEAQKVTDAQIAAQEAKINQQNTQRFALLGGVGLLLLFGGFMYNRFRVTRQQRDVIEAQKTEVEAAHEELAVKSKEITDSIQYAKRIQSAILPPTSMIAELLPASFVLYKPKDIVAGDFYWMEPVGDTIFFAAADCTGHGVPGAMVSVICVNGLNRSVREFGLTDPAQILDKTRELVIKEFEKSEEEVKDGMDIALCSLQGYTLKYAGANNPLWIVRKSDTSSASVSSQGAKTEATTEARAEATTEALEVEAELIEVKADKQPIGKYALEKPFTTHTVELQKDDTIYVFTDGYPDQFGGEHGKKYKSGKFKRTLLELAAKPIDQQKGILDTEFENWRGTLEQIDDVCVIGVRP